MRGLRGMRGSRGLRGMEHFAAVTVAALVCLMSACGGGSPAPPSTSSPTSSPTASPATSTPATAEGAGKTLHALFDREWEWRLQDWPLLATGIGDHRYDDKLPDASLAAWKARADKTDGFLKELAAIDRGTLSAADRINYDMFKAQLDDRRDGFRFDEHVMPLNADSGFHTDFALVPKQMAFATAADYDKYLSRLKAFPKFVDDQIAVMREGLKKGITIPRAALAGIESSIQPLITQDPTKSPLWDPFARVPATLDQATRDRLQNDGRAAIANGVTPAYQKFLTFMSNDYVPGARTTLAASDLPNGKDYYAFLVKRFTTVDVTWEQVHQTGLEQVAAIQKEMDEAMKKSGFKGTFAEFLTFLRTDPRFYPKTGDALLKEASFIAKRMDGKLPTLFGKLPRQPYGVAPVPEYLAPKYTAGRYSPNPPGGTEPGYYWVNTYALNTRPLYNLEALTLHEGVPGHHLQGALSYELDGLPPFRKWTYISAFGEGWGLYSEWLGLEAGFYTDPYSNFGRLTYAMWRAARLVVDTGLHAKGWTRQQAIDYLAQHTALSVHECTTETDRYISWPGQALSYKTGELKIRELRRRAEQTLGAKFDVRRFHDAVLGNGSVPLTVLEQVIDEFIAAEQKR
jgi:uncharacterized protein (DUF885 family)